MNSVSAWVLHKRWSGDTSAQVTFFTREQGLVRAQCQGGRAPKKQALLQAFTPLWITLDERRGWCYVRQLEVASPSLCFEGETLFAGLYVNELLSHALRAHDPDEALYDVYEHTLQALTATTGRLGIEAVLRRFEWALLCATGYQMSLTHEADSGLLITASQSYVFMAGEGFRRADSGINGAHIIAIHQGRWEDKEVLKVAKSMMRLAINHALGGIPIKARALYL